MSSLSELEMRILSELEEAGEDNFTALLNTVTQSRDMPTAVAEYQRSLKRLVELGYIRMATDRDGRGMLADLSIEESLNRIAEISTVLEFRVSKNHWTDKRRSGPPFSEPLLHVVNTPAGRDLGGAILGAEVIFGGGRA